MTSTLIGKQQTIVTKPNTTLPDKTMQNNYLTDYIESKGYTVQECRRPAKKEVPANMRDRYSSYEEYEEALHDFLNGM